MKKIFSAILIAALFVGADSYQFVAAANMESRAPDASVVLLGNLAPEPISAEGLNDTPLSLDKTDTLLDTDLKGIKASENTDVTLELDRPVDTHPTPRIDEQTLSPLPTPIANENKTRSRTLFKAANRLLASQIKKWKTTALTEAGLRENFDADTAHDVTEEFKQAQKDDLSSEELRKLGNDVTVVFIGGFLSKHLSAHSAKLQQSRLGRIIPKHRPIYFGGVMQALSDWGIEHRMSGVHPEEVSEKTVPRLLAIVEEAAAAGKRTLFFPHSHGNLDVLRTLIHIDNTPSKRHLLDSIDWISLQAPFLGSPMADWVVGSRFRHLTYWLLESMGGSRESLNEMTTKASLEYYQRHKDQIERIFKRVPAIAVATSMDSPHSDMIPRPLFSESNKRHSWVKIFIDSCTLLLRNLAQMETKSDGLVPVASSYFEGMDHIVIDGMSHFDPLVILRTAQGRHLLTALLRMMLVRNERMRSSPVITGRS